MVCSTASDLSHTAVSTACTMRCGSAMAAGVAVGASVAVGAVSGVAATGSAEAAGAGVPLFLNQKNPAPAQSSAKITMSTRNIFRLRRLLATSLR